MKDFLHHLFLPRESNNHRPRILHHQSLLIVILLFFVCELLFSSVKDRYQHVLGVSTNISSQVLLELTNSEREKIGLNHLTMNDKLSHAAVLKGENMFAKNYWAHNAPDGTQPWFFIKEAGYDYMYAGENLARGFSTSEDVVRAWMESPAHKENMLSQNYQDIGFAVVEGNLLGEQTTLVVQMFGSTKQPVLSKQTKAAEVLPETAPVVEAPAPQSQSLSVTIKPLIDSFFVARSLSMLALFMFIFVLIVDMIIIERKKIARVVGHNLDHVIFLSVIFMIVMLIQKGIVL